MKKIASEMGHLGTFSIVSYFRLNKVDFILRLDISLLRRVNSGVEWISIKLPSALLQSRWITAKVEPVMMKKGDSFQKPACLGNFVRLAPVQEVIAELRLSLSLMRLGKLRFTEGQSCE